MTKTINIKVSEVAFLNKKTLKKSDKEERYNYYDTSSVTKNVFRNPICLNKKDLPSRAKKFFDKNDIIFSTVRPNQRHYAFIEKEYFNSVCSTGFAVIKPNLKKINPYYLYLLITNDKTINKLQKIAESSAGTYPAIKPEVIMDLEFNIIEDIEEQNNLIKKLKFLSNQLILLKEQRINNQEKNNYFREELTLGSVKISIKKEFENEIKDFTEEQLIEWLYIDFENKIEFTKREEKDFKEERINFQYINIPKEWGKDKIINNIDYIKGKSIPEKQLNPNGEGIKYLKTSELWLDGKSKRETMYFNDEIDEKYLKQKDEYVFSLDGFNTEVGKGTLGLMSKEDEGLVSTGWYKIIHNEISHSMINIWNSEFINRYIVSTGVGTTAKHAGKFLKTYEFAKPTRIELILMNILFKKYDELDTDFDSLIKVEEEKFEYLMEELLSGRIRVK